MPDLQDDVVAQRIVAQPAADAVHDHVADGLLLPRAQALVCTKGRSREIQQLLTTQLPCPPAGF